MLSLGACGQTPRIEPLTPDLAKLKPCREYLVFVPALVPLDPVTLPDGREVVLLSRVLDRDKQTADWVIAEREGRLICKVAADYVADWSAEAAK